MHLASLAQTLALVIALATGLAVLWSNHRRGLNQAFAAFCLVQAVWMVGVMVLTLTRSETLAYVFLLVATLAAAAMPVAFNAVRLAVLNPDFSLVQLSRPNWYGVVLLAGVSVVCLSPLFLESITMPPDPNPEGLIIEPVYGLGFPLYAAYLILSFLVLLGLTIRNVTQLRGLARYEMQILLLGLLACILVGCTLGLLPPLLFGTSAGSPWTPACIMLVNVFIAYGMATRRILGIEAIIRRAVAYLLLGAYFVAVFSVLFTLLHWFLPGLEGLAAALITAMATLGVAQVPARSVHSLPNRLFGRWREISLAELTQRAESVLSTVKETSVLYQEFHAFLLEQLGVEEIQFLWFEEPTPELAKVSALHNVSISPSLRTVLEERPALPLSLLRRQGSGLPAELSQLLGSFQAHVMLTVLNAQGQASGAILVGERRSGRAFSTSEIEALQNVAAQFSRALTNARLFTKVERTRRSTQLLIHGLPFGVVALGRDRRVVFANPEANRLLAAKEDLVGKKLSELPASVCSLVEACLQDPSGVALAETKLPVAGGEVPVSLAVRRIEVGSLEDEICALLSCEDQTAYKSLEQQLRRADRLSHLGRLSASIVHEIKNPVTALSTFIQLMPQKREDAHFMKEFYEVASRELEKVEGTMHQLLDFAHVPDRELGQTDLHAAITQTERLLRADLKSAQLELEIELGPGQSLVTADPQQLEQVLLNLVLNAKEAAPSHRPGKVLITTSREKDPKFSAHAALSQALLTAQEVISLTVEDDGPGFSGAALASAFEPFFTTKESGTGLGLAIVFGLVQEMGGGIDLGNRPSGGAWIKVYFPTVAEKPAVH